MNRRRFVATIPFLAGLTACAAMLNAEEGPGMILTFSNGLKGWGILFDDDKIISSSGKRFASPGYLAPDKNPLRGGKTMGAAPDGRQLPEWVEFTWREAIYKKDDYTREQLKALPHKTGRVYIRSRVPQDVIDV